MSTDGKDGLFGDLPAQAGPGVGSHGEPRLRKADRSQLEWRSIDVDRLIAADHKARLVWRFVEQLDLEALYRPIKAVAGRPGHPPADPRILLALWLYATVQGIGSARALARQCQVDLGFLWLRGGVTVNHKSLSDFRVGHSALLDELLVDSFTALARIGVASFDRAAQDGMRVRASAGAASFRRHATLQECHTAARQHVARLRAELENDPAVASRREIAARNRAAADREIRVEEALAVTAALKAQQEEAARRRAERQAKEEANKPPPGPDQSGPGSETKKKAPEKEGRASTTDPQARVMKMADGGFRPAYNVQFTADTLSGAVCGVSTDNLGTDMGKMGPMVDKLQASYGQRPKQYLADGGFASFDDLEALAERGVTSYVPVAAPRDKTRDRFQARPSDTPAIVAWRKRMAEEATKEIYKQRAATIECVNAQCRNRGLTRFLVRGLDKVRAVAIWHALAHNMVCSWRLKPAAA